MERVRTGKENSWEGNGMEHVRTCKENSWKALSWNGGSEAGTMVGKLIEQYNDESVQCSEQYPVR